MIGKVISHYEIRRQLGAGGMGSVYEAVDQRLGRRVALKFLAGSLLESADARARFEREARAISLLNHPNIGTLYDFENAGGYAFLVLELLPGGTLRDRLDAIRTAGQAVPIPVAIDWAGQLAAGLGHAHRKGIVHRDVKPANVLFDEEDRLKITDFGLAKLRESARLTGTGTTMGTAAYTAPEQAIGHGEADHRADIFSLGVVLYEILSGDLPFKADTQLGTLHKVLNSPPEPLRARNPDVPEDLELVVKRCLDKNADGRFPTTDHLIAELRRLAGATQPWSRTDTLAGIPLPPPAPAHGDDASTIYAPAPRASVFRTGRRWWLLAALSVLLAVAGAILYEPLSRWLSGTPGERKLAVLPFENTGGDETAEAFARGLTETLTAAVTQIRSARRTLWVVPASDLRSQDVASADAARRAFGVNLAVTGSIRRDRDRVRVTINLVDAGATRQISSRILEAATNELPGLERRLLAALAEMLELELSPADGFRASGTEVAAAYDAYVLGRGFLQRFDRPGHLDLAVHHLETALRADPDYPMALAGLGEALLVRYDLSRELSWLNRSRSLNQRAAALDPELAQAFVNLCLLYTRTARFEEAIAAGRRALEIDSLNGDACRALAGAYDQSGQHAKAEETYQSAIDLQPGSWLAHKDLGVYCFHKGRLREAEREFRKVIELTPDNEWGYRNLAAVFQSSGRYGEAEALLKQAVEAGATAVNLSNLGSLYFALGRYEEAARALERAVALAPEDAIIRGNLGDAYRAIAGSRELADAAYLQAIEIGQRKLAVSRADAVLLTGLAVYSAKIGRHDDALAYVQEAAQTGNLAFNLKYQCAVVHLLAGRRDAALAMLEEAIAGGYPAPEMARDPDLVPLRSEPRFLRLVSRPLSPAAPAH